MKAFASAFLLEWRSLVRSKAAALLAVAALGWMAALPRIAGGGTADNAAAIDARYALGSAFAIVLVSLSAAAAGSLAREREEKRLQLSAIRPVRLAVLAAARIAALAMCGSAVLAACCAILAWRTGPSLPCDRAYPPVLESPSNEARRLYEEYCEKYADFREKAEQAGKMQTLRYLEEFAKSKMQTVAPGETAVWNFPAPAGGDGARLAVRCRFIDAFGRLEKMAGTFRFGGAEGEIGGMNKTEARVPLSRKPEGGASTAPGTLEFRNNGRIGATLSPRNDLRLLEEDGTFAGNAARAWIVLSAVLCMALSIGVFLGACFGRSVAVFCTMALLAMSVMAPAAVEGSIDPLTATKAERLGLDLALVSEAALSPLNAFHPVAALESRETIPLDEALRACAAGFIAYPALFSLLAGLAMAVKRE
ncbi:MAG: hypothetical protein IIT98_02165 [Kiritimatiellae bacterium]|nr:hypothetical protein [Kiritimatiellia bacterium]